MSKLGLFPIALSLLLNSCIVIRGDRGYVTVTWSLAAAGQAVACNPGDEVNIAIAGQSFDYSCFDGQAYTPALPPGSYSAVFSLYAANGSLVASEGRSVVVYSSGSTDAGHVVFSVPPALGSASFTWSIHQNSPTAPAEGCVAGDSIGFSLPPVAPFTIPCDVYTVQPILDLVPGVHTGVLTFYANGAAADTVQVDFTVNAGLDTPVHVDFVILTPGRSERPPARAELVPAPAQSALPKSE